MDLEKETMTAIVSGGGGSVAHIAKKVYKGEKMTFGQIVSSLIVSGFVGFITLEILKEIGLKGGYVGFLVGMTSFMGIKILEAFDLLKPSDILNFILDFISYKKTKGQK